MSKKFGTTIPGCFELQPEVLAGSRCQFPKIYPADYFISNKLETDFREHYYPVSRKGVLRETHFQNPPKPNGHSKLIYCTSGIILDDDGTVWSSTGMDWRNPAPVISGSNLAFVPLIEFQSPFKFVSVFYRILATSFTCL